MTAGRQRRRTDRGWRGVLIRENAYRDVWLLCITGLVLWAVSLNYQNAQDAKVFASRLADIADRTNTALCTFRADVRERAVNARAFLADHPEGIPGVPVATLRQSIEAQERTVRSLATLGCPPDTP